MKYTYEIKLKAVKSIKKGILIDEPYNKISRQWRDRVKYWEKIYDLQGKNGLKRQYRWHTYKEKLQNNGDGPHYFFQILDTHTKL